MPVRMPRLPPGHASERRLGREEIAMGVHELCRCECDPRVLDGPVYGGAVIGAERGGGAAGSISGASATSGAGCSRSTAEPMLT